MLSHLQQVSIPNGMEFYRKKMKKISLGQSFNSQRDGILLNCRHSILSFLNVSIPNGMEFYLGLAAKMRECMGFNSQRDGILQIISLNLWLACWAFQFPTGWNSTYIRDTLFRQSCCFNSQRDGILQLLFYYKVFSIWVSIPNGMEFYLILKNIKSDSFHWFQFPTGWNSTNCFAFF